MSEPRRITLCRLHGAALIEAARGCGCRSEEEQRNFLADCLAESGLYDHVLSLAGDAVADSCLLCCYVFPNDAIDAAVASALALRARHGLRARLN